MSRMLLLLLVCGPHPVSSAFMVHSSHRALHSAPSQTAVWYRDNDDNDTEPPDDTTRNNKWTELREKKEQLFDHDDWVEYRADSNTSLDVFWTLFGVLTCYLFVAALLL